jgi:fructokinase
MTPYLLGVGEILWDMLPAGKQLGGAVTNFAFHAKQLGAEAAVVSAVGEDALGREILDRLKQLGLPGDFLAVDSAHPTGTVDVTLDASGKPTYIIHENVAWDFVPWTPALAPAARRADAVCFGSLAQRSPVTRKTIHDLLAATRCECLRVFDINLRQSFYSAQIIESSLQQANVLKLNDEELPVVAKLLGITGDDESILRALIRRYKLRLVALTRGPIGSTLMTPDASHTHPGIATTVADTVGAGDAFTAAIVIGLLKHTPLETMNNQANRLAAYVCSQPGATPSLPKGFITL